MDLRDILLNNSSEKDELMEIKDIVYCPDVKNNLEHFEATAVFSSGHQQLIKSHETMWMYNWQRMMDLNIYENEQETKSNIIGLSTILDMISSIRQTEKVETFFERYIKELEKQPFLWVFLRDLVQISRRVDIEGSKEQGNKALKEMRALLQQLTDKLSDFHEYIYHALILPYESGKKIDPLRLLLNFEMYCNVSGEHSSLAKSVFYHNDQYGDLMINDRYNDILDFEAEAYKHQIVEPYLVDGDLINNNLYFVDELFLSGIQYLIHSELIPKKCQLCGRYFLNKYSYVANYCNVPYKDTKDTCQEYVSKIKYKSKVSKNQINTEYSTIYNRLYSRIRRGTIDKSEAKFDELKALRDEYMIKYEVASYDEKPRYVEAFKIKANRLYSTTEMKEKLRKKLGLKMDEVYAFNDLALDKSLETFKIILDNQINMSNALGVDEILHRDMVENLIKIVKNIDEEEWFEIQCAMPFDDPTQ